MVFPRNVSTIVVMLLSGHRCILFIAGGRFLEGNITLTITCSPWYMALDCAVSCSLLPNLFASGFKWLQSTFAYDILFARNLHFSTWLTKNINIPGTKQD
jgi:hypothetical protein